SGLFVVSPVQDAADARHVIANIDQGGFGLPDRDYYLGDDESTVAMRAAYQAYVESVLTVLGHRTARQEAAEIVALETEIARVSRDRSARPAPRGNYHKIDPKGAARAMPRLDGDAYWAGLGLKAAADVTVPSVELLAGLDKLLASTRPEVWRSYLAFHLADDA